MKYYILMNGKRSAHVYDETLIDGMIARLTALFPDVEFEKSPVKEEKPCSTDTKAPSITAT